jgi:hypothetical protein
MMRILFYLPVVTPWWFDSIVAPLIRAAARGGEVHVLVPPLWRNTGIGPEQYTACADLDGVTWHILHGEEHPQLRESARDLPELLDLVHAITPDLCLCRSADIETPAAFPGVVRYIMEGGTPPFSTDIRSVYLAHTLFDHGLLPPLPAQDREWLISALGPAWQAISERAAQTDRDAFLDAAGLPACKTLIGLPLEYEHEEIFFGQHSPYGDNIALIEKLAPALDDDTVLAVTNHPINELHGDPAPLHAAIARYNGKVRMVGQTGQAGEATMLLARHCNGMVVGNSKSFGHCAFFGTPMLRLSKFATGAWMHAQADWPAFLSGLKSGEARGPDAAEARCWFGFHLANNVFDSNAPWLDAAALADRATNPVNRDRWEAGLAGHFAFSGLAPPPLLPQTDESLCHV